MSRSFSSRCHTRVGAGIRHGLVAVGLLLSVSAGRVAAEPSGLVRTTPDSETTLADIERCVSENLPAAAGRIEFSVDAVDRRGTITASRAELRWRKPVDEPTQILLVVSEPAKTAGTALLIIDRKADKPEFFVRLPEMKKVKRVRSRRLRGPVLGTDFSYEDLKRLREPLDETQLELIGATELDDRPAWVLEAIPGDDDGSEYSRVLTYVDQSMCLPIRIDLFESGVDGSDRLRKRLDASREDIRPTGAEGARRLPHRFVMQDFLRESQTIIRIESFEAVSDLPAKQFTRAGLQESARTPPSASKR